MGFEKVALENGETLAYRKREGDGSSDKTILLLHGNTSSSVYWDTLTEALDPKYTIYAVDLRGFGDSSYERPAQRIEDYSHDVEEWLKILDVKHVIVIGWSMGGAVAMDMCIDNVDGRIEKCILVSSASTRGYPFFLQGNQRFAKTYDEIKNDPFVTKSFEAMLMMHNSLGVQAVLDQMLYTHRKPETGRYANYIRAVLQQRNVADVYYALHTFNIIDEIDQIQVPLLIIYGDRDNVVSKEMTEEIITDFGDKAQVLQLKDCGHAPMVDQLPLLTEAIEKFI